MGPRVEQTPKDRRVPRSPESVEPGGSASSPDTAARAPKLQHLWLFRLLALVGGPVAFFLVLELVLRLAGVGHDPRFFLPLPALPGSGESSVMTNPAFGWRFFPPEQARRPLPQRVALPKPPGLTRIVVLGGSAAMGIPDPAFSFGRFLGVMFERSGGGAVEVVDAGMTAINSHVVREIASELGRLEPDLVIIYMGNNEVVGPWGLTAAAGASGEGGGPPGLAAIQATSLALETRTGQFVADLLRPESRGSWRGMAALAEHRVAWGDRGLDRIYQNFSKNLDAIIKEAQKSGAEVIVSTVAVDLLSTPPFASEIDPDLGAEARDKLEKALAGAADLMTHPPGSRAHQDAAEHAEVAVEIDPGHALARYLVGRAELASGELEAARESLSRARDLDALRFRADSRINAEIRASAARRGAIWVDSAARLAERSPAGVPGEDFFYEHVHFTPEGAFELARGLWKSWKGEEPPLSPNAAFKSLGLTPWHRLGQSKDIAAMMARPPFTFQIGIGRRQSAMDQQLRRLERALASEGAYGRVDAALRLALAERPDDIPLRRSWLDLLISGGDGEGAMEQARLLLERLPRSPGLWLDAGNAAMAAEALDEAAEFYRRAGELDPHSPDIPFNQGVLNVRRSHFEAAVAAFARVLELAPNHLEARLNVAAALERLGRTDDALEALRRTVEELPHEPLAVHRLIAALELQGAGEEASQRLEAALARFPDDGYLNFEWARRLAERGEEQAAIRHYARALGSQPELAEARSNLVELHNRRAARFAEGGDGDGAITALRKALAADPDHAPSHFNLAMVLGREGRKDAAIEHLQRAYEGAHSEGLESLKSEAESRLRALGRWPVERAAEK